jgi:hypothetical protein
MTKKHAMDCMEDANRMERERPSSPDSVAKRSAVNPPAKRKTGLVMKGWRLESDLIALMDATVNPKLQRDWLSGLLRRTLSRL